ncbi:MAG: UDP-N-acetylglucosamine 2-epimerase (non-hydrolyzing) [Planctomycetaceae bacterium]|jgi:UDP-N-acetylglucosamine 2-epimerase (non-hydrolysing)|nr:UDP-N-acetylglucosamine 2-epimerase (non-hydrolyzing) [Planctomycetaceae bacterium]
MTSKKRFALIAGARPNFMKIAPIIKAMERYPEMEVCLIHTGQHYDKNLSDVFFQELGIRKPDIALGVGSGSHAKQTAEVMVAIESLLVEAQQHQRPFTAVIVVGDVNSTMAAALAATKLHIPVVHVEAGLRSRDRSMPEEINRLVTDSISDLLLCSEPAGVENLLDEGHSRENVHLVGNVMIDTLLSEVARAKEQKTLQEFGLEPGKYGVVTLHRPGNVDQKETLEAILQVLSKVSKHLPIVFPVHPRTRSRIDQFGLQNILGASTGCRIAEPLGYLDCLCLTSQAKVVVTDSGGLQEESTALGVPCLTLRPNTERPITCSEGTGTLIGNSAELLDSKLQEVLSDRYKVGSCPQLWDGQAALRIVDVLAKRYLSTGARSA